MTLSALIVDDEAPARKRLRDLLGREPDVELVGECSDGPAAVAAILELGPDVVFLDVQMPEMSGFDVLRSVGLDAVNAVVFVTAYDQHAVEAFEARAVDYLLKPFTRERFRETLERVRSTTSSARAANSLLARIEELVGERSGPLERIPVRSGTRIRFVKVSDVAWIEADGNYVVLHTPDGPHRVRGTMKGYAARLADQSFVRIHQSHIVNLDRVKELQPWSHGEFVVIMPDGAQLISSRTYSGALRRRLEI